jgi:hypothetical protein
MEKPREKRKSISKVLEGAEQVAHEGDREETGPSPKKKTKKQSSTSSKSPRKAKQKSGDEDHHASAEGRPPWFIFLVCFIFIYIFYSLIFLCRPQIRKHMEQRRREITAVSCWHSTSCQPATTTTISR